MQDQGCGNPRPQMFRVGGDSEQGLGRGLEQDLVEHRLVGIGEIADGRRQGKDQVIIVYRQQIGLAGLEPSMCGAALALGAMSISTGVVGDLNLFAGATAQYVATERGAAAAFDGRHNLELAETQVPGV